MLKSRTILALGLLVLVAGATVYKVTRKDPHVKDASAASPLAISRDAVDELEIAEPGKPAVVLKKEGAEWKLAQPVADRADQKAVEQAVEGLSELKLRDVIAESPESYEKVGVKDDEVVKVVPRKGGAPVATLLVGKTSNVRLEGDPRVWSTSNLKRWTLVKDAKLWRDRKILDFPVDQVDAVAVSYPSGAKVVAKKESPPPPPAEAGKDAGAPPVTAAGPDKWALVEGADRLGGALDGNVPLELASTLARLQADEIVDEPKPEATGLDAPRATVTVTLKDGKSHTLKLGKQDGNAAHVQLEGNPRVWKIQKYEAERIPTSPAQWRDKTIVKLAPESVQRLEIQKGTERTVLERAGEGWKAATPASLGDVETSRVQAILRAVEGLRATRVVESPDMKALGLDKPRATVTVVPRSGAPVKLAFGAEKDGQTAVQVGGQKDAHEVPSYTANSFIKSPADFKKSATGADPHAH
jgi:hypothetical protein